MPLFYQQDINENTKLAIWKIEEEAAFFSNSNLYDPAISQPQRKTQHLAGRYLLRFLFPGFPTDQILITESNKPYLPDNTFYFSISHTSHFAAAIVSRSNNVGIDIELMNYRAMKVAHKFLNETEMQLFPFKQKDKITDAGIVSIEMNDSSDITMNKLATIIWSCKETIYKWWGKGMVDFSSMIEVGYFDLKDSGQVNTLLKERDTSIISHQPVEYKLFQDLCLCYTCH